MAKPISNRAIAMVKLGLRSHHWIVDSNDNIVFGRGRMIILESISQTGSINQTAKNLKMSYKTVWSKIKSTEKHLKAKVVHADRREMMHRFPWQAMTLACYLIASMGKYA